MWIGNEGDAKIAIVTGTAVSRWSYNLSTLSELTFRSHEPLGMQLQVFVTCTCNDLSQRYRSQTAVSRSNLALSGECISFHRRVL